MKLADVQAVRATFHSAFSVLLLSGATVALGAADTPVAFPASRYEKILAKSPFALATPPAPVVQGPKFTDNLKVRGVARIGGKHMVTVMNRETAQSFPLFDGEPSADGIMLVSVDWNSELYKSKVVVRKGSEDGVLEWDTQASQAVQVAPPNPGVPGAPGVARPPGVQPGMPATRLPAGTAQVPRPGQPNFPQVPRPNPTIQPGAPRVPTAQIGTTGQQVVIPGQVPGQPGTGETRRRIRIINKP